jgi:hypothetical protein
MKNSVLLTLLLLLCYGLLPAAVFYTVVLETQSMFFAISNVKFLTNRVYSVKF